MIQLLDAINFNGIPITLSEEKDVFGRVMTTEPRTITDIRNYLPTKGELFEDAQLSGSGTSITYNANGYMDLAVGTAIGHRIARSKVAINYQNGKAPIMIFTGNFLTNEPNVTKYVGLSYGSNYLVLENTNGTIQLSFGSATLGNSTVLRSAWDDPLDGTGNSKVNIDLTRNFLFIITFQYLGVGGLYAGFRRGLKTYIAHQFNKNNSEFLPYWSTPNLFLQYGINKTVAGGSSSTFRGICATAINNGTNEARQIPLYLNNTNNLSLGTAGSWKPLIFFRLNPSWINSTVIIIEGLVLVSGTFEVQTGIIRNPNIGAFSPTWTTMTNTSVQYQYINQTNYNAVTLTITNEVDIKFLGLGSNSKPTKNIDEVLPLTSKSDGTPDIFCFAVKLFNNNLTLQTSHIKLLEEV